ncbi:MAG TPA: hypothetical protein EYQ84_07070 [Nitrospinaceae bacterium]|nr:hypothetical protein [Nitrospinaceae bacterium]
MKDSDLQNIPDIDVAEFLSADFLPDEIFETIAQEGEDVEASSELPKYITNYIGSKQKLIDWIWQNTPEDVKSVFDAFGGSNVVGFLYKRKGLSQKTMFLYSLLQLKKKMLKLNMS